MRYTTFGRRAGMRFSEHDLGTGNFDLVLATKLAVGASSDRKLSRTGNARKNLRISVEESLARPDTGYIDVLWVHSAERELLPMVEALAAAWGSLVHTGPDARMTPIIESRRLAHLDDHLAALTLELDILRGGLDESFDAPVIPVE